jgi:hypothetical protein
LNRSKEPERGTGHCNPYMISSPLVLASAATNGKDACSKQMVWCQRRQ